MVNGMIQLYIGNGKGKTTALIGQMVRAKGAGLRCALFQFLKQKPTGEAAALESLGVPVQRAQTDNDKFLNEMTSAERGAYLTAQRALYSEAVRAMHGGQYDLVALDEVLDLVDMGALDLEALCMALKATQGVEVVLTGRAAPQALCHMADYITHMRALKHPYQKGVKGRQGIEY